jgi:hypothetical protein
VCARLCVCVNVGGTCVNVYVYEFVARDDIPTQTEDRWMYEMAGGLAGSGTASHAYAHASAPDSDRSDNRGGGGGGER